jgi:hypothetical protein
MGRGRGRGMRWRGRCRRYEKLSRRTCRGEKVLGPVGLVRHATLLLEQRRQRKTFKAIAKALDMTEYHMANAASIMKLDREAVGMAGARGSLHPAVYLPPLNGTTSRARIWGSGELPAARTAVTVL